jgi:HD-GYP domain-containing protein (c-di-GMP phosphodiesterase class II)
MECEHAANNKAIISVDQNLKPIARKRTIIGIYRKRKDSFNRTKGLGTLQPPESLISAHDSTDNGVRPDQAHGELSAMAGLTPRTQDVLLSGGFGTSTNSARSGFLPVSLARLPLAALDGISIYLRSAAGPDKKETFTLFSAENLRFTQKHQERLTQAGVKFVYISMAQQAQFRAQTENKLMELATEPSIAVSIRSEIVYETCVELMNELLSEPDLAAKSPRLEKVSRAVTTLVLNDPTAFSHLFAASHHDFYTATHMVNVSTWMVPLAYALGHHDVEELNQICTAGLLHDIGKMYVSGEILNKKGKLSAEEFAQIQRHPELGCEHLKKYAHIHPLVMSVTMEHHERMDGSGYPRKLLGSQTHPISRLCAVVDSFDAMTAFRPFKDRTMTVAQAVKIIVDETPQKYDPQVVDAWIGLLKAAEKLVAADIGPNTQKCRREFQRFPINCTARLHILESKPEGWEERLGMPMVAHNISRGGVGLLSKTLVQPGEHVRVYLLGAGTLNRMNEGVTVRCREYRDGWFEVGMQSAPILADAQFDALAAQLSATAAA